MNTIRKKTGHFLFSLDTELAWGYFDQFKARDFSFQGQEERKSIRSLLDILHEFHITGTWGVVGHMLYEKCENCKICPVLDWKGKYKSFEYIYETNSRLWYGPDILESILKQGDGHEIAFHGYTHRVFNEKTMNRNEARIEIEEWLRLAQRKNITPFTIIFPRNKVGFLDLFKEYGFACYRGSEILPKVYSYPLIGRLMKRYHRYLSSFITPQVFGEYTQESSDLFNVPSTQHLFGFSRSVQKTINALDLHKLCIDRIKKGIQTAAEEGKVYHLRAHPNDFRSEKDFDILRHVFGYANEEIARGRLLSLSMSEFTRNALRGKTEPVGEPPTVAPLKITTV